MNTEQYIEYARHMEVSDKVITWLSTTLKNHLEKNNPTQTEVEHVIDYLAQNEVVKINQMSYPQAVKKADTWIKELQKKASEIQESKEDTKTVLDFKDGFKIVQLIGENAYKREGYLMRHCVASYYGKSVKIYSLRDAKNEPHATLEEDMQIKGKGNGSIHPKYIEYVVKFLEYTGMDVRDSEMLNLGYINVEKFKKYLHKDCQLFRDKYWYKENRLMDKEGGDFACFELLDKVLLIDEKTIKVNFKLETFVKGSIDFLFKHIKNVKSKSNDITASSGDYAQIGSSGDSAKIGSSGDSAKIGSSGNSAQIGSSGDSAKIGSSGDFAKIGSSGDSAKIGSSGDYAKIGSSGDFAKIGSSGDYAQIGSSGDSAKIGSSGDSAKIGSSGYSAQIGSSGYSAKIGSSGNYAQIGSSGDSAKIGSSGNYAQIGSSGDFAKIDVSGKDTVCASIGYNGRVKGILGTWITLAEYNDDGKPICVKSAIIDGKKLKPNTWYKLKNKKFTEVKE